MCRNIFYLLVANTVIMVMAFKTEAQNIDWVKFHGAGYPYASSCYKTIRCSNGQYLMSGYKTDQNGNPDVLLLRTDMWGTKVWEKTYSYDGECALKDVVQTSDGGFIAVGQSYDPTLAKNYEILILRTDGLGNKLWDKQLGGHYDDYGVALVLNDDGTFMIGATTYSNDGDISGNHSSTGKCDYWIAKFTPDGTMLWSYCYGGQNDDELCDIAKASDGGYYLVGNTKSNDGQVGFVSNWGDFDMWLVKINSEGTIVWKERDAKEGNDDARRVCSTQDNGFVVAGRYNYSALTRKYNNQGIKQWENKIQVNNGSSSVTDICELSDGTFLMGYLKSYYSGEEYSYFYDLRQIKSTGGIIWNLEYEQTNTIWETTYHSVLEGAEGSFIASGTNNDEYFCGTYWGLSGTYAFIQQISHRPLPPVFDIESGTFEEAQSFRITASGGAKVYYTSDGTAPQCGTSLGGTSYVNITTPNDTGVYVYRAIACKTGQSPSNEATVTITIERILDWITIWPESSTSTGAIWFSIYAPPNSIVHYTNNGSVPTCNSPMWGNPPVNLTTPAASGIYVYKAIACREGWRQTPVVTGQYMVTGTLSAPVFTPPDQTSTSPITFTINAMQGALIRYTDDGSNPSCNSGYSGYSPLTVTTPSALGHYIYKAIACMDQWNTSPMSSAEYIVSNIGINFDSEPETGSRFHPNPFNQVFNVKANDLSDVELQVTTVTGTVVYSYNTNNHSDFSIHLENLPPGLYFAIIRATKGGAERVFSEKIIKQ